jgi:hypothetical protein
LKQKKLYENQLAQLTQQTFNMESAALTTENLRNTMATVEAMKVANKELKKQYGKIDIDKIEVGHRLSFMKKRIYLLTIDRTYNSRWKTYWNRPMRFKSLWDAPMPFRTS